MRIRRVAAIAGVVAAMVVVAGGTLVGAGVALRAPAVNASAGKPYPILGPITPAGHPYDELAILRRQRMSDDVLPAAAVKSQDGSGPKLVAGSARLLVSRGPDTVWLVVNSADEVCVMDIDAGGGGATGCTEPNVMATAGESLVDVTLGGGHFSDGIQVVADGAPAKGVIHRGYRQVAPNVWMSKGSHATPVHQASAPHDPLAFPLQAPYSHFAILRRPQTAADAPPKSWYSDDTTDDSTLVPSSVRYAGSYKSYRVYVGVEGDGETCLKTSDMSICGMDLGPVSAGLGDNGKDGSILLVRDSGDHANGMDKGSIRIGQNVWWTPQG
ncbi:hypothetical protein [Frondihabitans australicus]|uniref:Uncharacterized protein n=1 Tax=Frondihabitans australicus TaxID=386892 RepID=A0A495IKU1_9MICO|nr:hypothetical protein [Frondihabitans australicus]RKR76399.1 hypothetical protein C8E83_3572 [Frondihabitans australicus]